MQTLIIDNYDSFTYNLYQYVGELNGNPQIFRNDKITIQEVKKINPDKIIISPGPGTPEDPAYFGVCLDIIKKLGHRIPILGVCLGHQGIVYAFGGKIIKAPKIMHGKTSLIKHNKKDIFKNIPSPLTGMRYHSLIAENKSFPLDELEIVATVENEDIIMAIKHKTNPIYGIQFHPESIGTNEGKKILKNFLDL